MAPNCTDFGGVPNSRYLYKSLFLNNFNAGTSVFGRSVGILAKNLAGLPIAVGFVVGAWGSRI
jgi:hypothetical protein